jgi:hypothetical protein
MALGICAVCGYACDVEQHHVAGEANFPDLTIPVCRSCHTELHRRLSAHGVELRRDVTRTFPDPLRALVIGYSVLCQLHIWNVTRIRCFHRQQSG